MNTDPTPTTAATPEYTRLLQNSTREIYWKKWGPYLSERQWGTVREDYSENGDVWTYFTHDDARSRAYRWGEDGLLGFTDRYCRLCFAWALWNGKDAILKERLFGLTGPQGNHGEDVKDLYYYLDSTPTHSYFKALYKYPQAEFPYQRLIEENQRRDRHQREFELLDTGIFDDHRYYDFQVEVAKVSAGDLLIRATIANRGPDEATLHVLPTLWFRNTWSWGMVEEEATLRPEMHLADGKIVAVHETLGNYRLACEPGPLAPEFLFTENDTNNERLFGTANASPFVKDAFHAAVVHGQHEAVNPEQRGTKAALHYTLTIPAGGEVVLRLRLTTEAEERAEPFGPEFDDIFRQRIAEADGFYAERIDPGLAPEQKHIARSAYAGLFWSKQFYNLVQTAWAQGDPACPVPPPGHQGKNADWEHLFSRDVLSMPDKWEFPYFCSWDLAFHAVSLCRVDPALAKDQLTLLLREWYMHPNGQLPAYEFAFSDVNPPVHPWAAWRVYRLPWLSDQPDRKFLEACFQKLLLNFNWWVNREDLDGNNLFAGGFLGLDNIGVFDRSKPLPTGGTLRQADGSSWMAFYCVQMLSIALELAVENRVYEDLASKFFEHFVRITHAINELGGHGLWDEQDGFYYDQLELNGRSDPLRVRSLAGFVPMFAATIIRAETLRDLPEFVGRRDWFIRHRPQLARHVVEIGDKNSDLLLSIPSRPQLERMLARLFDEEEFLSPFGIRSVSKYHEKNPYVYWVGGTAFTVNYEPGEGTTGMFGGNSNWRGPVWFPINYLILESLRVYHRFYGDTFQIEFPTGSGVRMNLGAAARNLARRLQSLLQPGPGGRRPCHGDETRYATDPHWNHLLLFNEYYHADTGRGCGASHQTGWTALIADLLSLEEHWE